MYKKSLGFGTNTGIYSQNHEEDLKFKIKPKNKNALNENNNFELKKIFKYLKDMTKDFLINSSLHGLKYTADEELTIFERIFFVISFIFVVMLSGYFIGNVWNKWKETPIIISTSPTPIFTTSIPFPSITICNLNQVRKSRVMKLKKGTYNYTLLWNLCGQDTGSYIPNHLGNWKNFRLVMLELAQPCTEMLQYCSFGGKKQKCSQIFQSILTDDGLCCNFNSVNPQYMLKNYSISDSFDLVHDNNITAINWTPESGYPDVKNLPFSFYPRIARGTGKNMGLTIKLNASSQEYFCSATKGYGFKILVHSPIEQPKIRDYGFLLNTGNEVRVDISPTYSVASAAIRSIHKEVRHCLFSDEGNLTYYKTYTRKNCEQECIAKHMFRECGCVLYYLPRLASDIKICGPIDNNCTQYIESIISEANNNITCENCYSACFDLTFLSSISSVKFAKKILTDGDNNSNVDLIFDDIAIIHFYYGSNSFHSMTKDEIVGFTEFLSNTGGLLGLFMGFSILSLIEIVYFLSLRPYCNYKKTTTTKSDLILEPYFQSNNSNLFTSNNKNVSKIMQDQKDQKDSKTKTQKDMDIYSKKSKQKNIFKRFFKDDNSIIYPYYD